MSGSGFLLALRVGLDMVRATLGGLSAAISSTAGSAKSVDFCVQAFRSGGGAMRAHLLTTTAAVALLAALPARAQDATWSTAPGSSNFNTAANWTPATVPTGTAFFGASNTTSIAFQAFTTTSVGTLQFNPGATAYSFTTENGFSTSISITGTGIVNNSSNAPTFIIGNQANIFFAMRAPPATPS